MATFRERFDLKEEVIVRMGGNRGAPLNPEEPWMRGRVRFIGPKGIRVAVLTPEGRFYTETDITRHSDILSRAEIAASKVRARSIR